MHYVCGPGCDVGIEFGDSFQRVQGGMEDDFLFSYLDEWRVAAELAWNNGVIRATAAIEMFEWESFTWVENVWHKRYGVVTNIGVFVFDNTAGPKDHKNLPEFFHWNHFDVKEKKANETQDNKKNLFEFGNNEVFKLYSIGSREEMLNFTKSMKAMKTEFQRSKNIL